MQLRRHLVHPATLRNAIRKGCVFLWQEVTRLEGDFCGAKTRRASKAQSNSAQSPSRHFKSRKFKHLRLFCFYISRQTQYLRGLRGCDAAQSQYLSHLRRNTRPPENRQNWRFVGVFSTIHQQKSNRILRRILDPFFRFFSVRVRTYF